MTYTTDDIRNLALVGQASSGKTSLCESILVAAGEIATKGEIERGSTVSDFDPLEKKHQRSLTSSVMSVNHKGARVNLIDTPGYSDFIGTSLAALEAVETAAVVINAQTGVDSMVRRHMESAAELGVCRMIVINRIDADGVELEQLYGAIQEEFGSGCLALNLPSSGGVTSCFPDAGDGADFSSPEDVRTALIEQVVEVDEDLMEEYLENAEIDVSRLAPVMTRAIREGHLIPVCFVSAQTDAGINELMDVIADCLPSPAQGNLPEFTNAGDSVKISADAQEPLLAHVFKVLYDPFVGKLGIFRIYQGAISKDSSPFVGDSRKTVRVSNLYQVHGKSLSDKQSGIAGDILGVSKIEEIEQGSLLHESSDGMPGVFAASKMPMPMVGLAVAPAARGDEQKVAESLHKIAAEDPCISVERDPDANETVLRGLGELHLRVALERLSEVYGVEVTTTVPTVPYRETITKTAEGHCRHKKQTGGAGQFGEVFMRVEPLPRGEGFEFVDSIVGGVIPGQFIPAVEKGVRQVLREGAFAGFPLQDVRVVIYDGKHHSVDSKEIAFITAGRKAFIDAVSKAGAIVLEPIVDVAVDVPSSNMGDIAGELSSRRGRIIDTDSTGSNVRIKGAAPLAEMSDFQSRLNAISGGEGSFIMEFSSYEPAPMEVQKKLSASFRHVEEE